MHLFFPTCGHALDLASMFAEAELQMQRSVIVPLVGHGYNINFSSRLTLNVHKAHRARCHYEDPVSRSFVLLSASFIYDAVAPPHHPEAHTGLEGVVTTRLNVAQSERVIIEYS